MVYFPEMFDKKYRKPQIMPQKCNFHLQQNRTNMYIYERSYVKGRSLMNTVGVVTQAKWRSDFSASTRCDNKLVTPAINHLTHTVESILILY